MKQIPSINAYIKLFPPETQRALTRMRGIIRKAAPDAKEIISYQIPTFYQKGNLVHFAAYKNHIGFYPTGGGVAHFMEELRRLEKKSGDPIIFGLSKGTVRFPIDKALPAALIAKIVRFRVKESEAKDKKANDPFHTLAAPAQRALKNGGIKSVKQLARKTKSFVSQLHGMGPNALKQLDQLLKKEGLKFQKEKK